MHRLAATPGGWTPGSEGVIFLEQTPAPLVVLTAADTEIQCLATARHTLPETMPALRVASLLQLQQQLSVDAYAETVLSQAKIIILRLLGGQAYWPYGLEVVQETATSSGAHLIVLPGDDQPDPSLMSRSNVPLTVADRLWRYFTAGGPENLAHGLMWICDRTLDTAFAPPAPREVPKVGVWSAPMSDQAAPSVALLFYRAHYLAGNTAPISVLAASLTERGLAPIPVFAASLQDIEIQGELRDMLQAQEVDLVLNTTSFAIAKINTELQLDLWQALGVPVLQVILSGGTEAAWRENTLGLSPRDVAMNVALPEVDGRIISRAVSFKNVARRDAALETDVVTYEPVDDRIAFVADLAANWVALRRTPPADRRIAVILANYPNRDGRLANGVGLDTPQSCIEILRALQRAGYGVDDIPATGDELIWALTAGVTNDPESRVRPVGQSLPLDQYQAFFESLPESVQVKVIERWGQPQTPISISGLQLGHIFVGIQPSRGYDADPSLNYHAPDLEPTHDYLGFYGWLRHGFQAQAILHVGKHGNLEWLPGKGVGLSAGCYPEAALGPLPHLYPFIVNDPGEGAQAKRRAQAVIIDHLTPPLTRAELYGPLEVLEGWVDEYYEAQSLDPSRLPLICDRILQLLQEQHLWSELVEKEQALGTANGESAHLRQASMATLLPLLDGYLCELKEAQIRDGLHIFGRCPAGPQLRDLAVAIARHPSPGRLGLTRAIARAWHLDIDPLVDDPSHPWQPPLGTTAAAALQDCRNIADVIEAIEAEAARLVDLVLTAGALPEPDTEKFLAPELNYLKHHLLPALRQSDQEIQHLLLGLDGGYVPSGPAGAPTRNRPDVLPTGRNFFSVDIRAIPTESAWDVGRRAAETLVERYTQDHGEYPRTLAVSVWGTATMRTGGDDLAEAFALLGVRPVWDGPSRRVVDFEIVPAAALGRPRVDVTLRISGFFRDAFTNLIDLFDQAVAAVAALSEPPQQNPLAAAVQQEAETWQQQGLTPEQAQRRASFRIFGSKPGAYGAGLQGLIDAQNWETDADLARAYINWSSYAYGHDRVDQAPEAFQQRLQNLQIVLQNQDNREHDLLDSDDYYQFQGGLTAAVRVAQNRQPTVYFGDHALPEKPQIRTLEAEIARVYRSRVINPKWIAGAMRHGYKGAFEMAATVDYLFAYDATAQCVPDHIYKGVSEAYVLDGQVQTFLQASNPWALRDMAERLLEAHQRGLWQGASPDILDQLRQAAHQAEETLENRQTPYLS